VEALKAVPPEPYIQQPHKGAYMKKGTRHPKKIFMLCILLICAAGLHGSWEHPARAESENTAAFKGKLLVLPFHNMAAVYGTNKHVRCPICGKVFITGEVPDKATEYLSNKLVSMLRKKRYSQKMVTSNSQWGDVDLMLKKNRNLSDREMVVAAGRSAKAEAVMIGYLYRFRQRVGTRLSVDTPASVAFGIHLIDVKTGREFWKGHVDETQKSLSENLFNIGSFIKQKASWVTAEELAVLGLEEILETLPEK